MNRPAATASLPLGEFRPADEWQVHVNAIFYGLLGPGIHDHFQTHVSLDHRLAWAHADRFLRSALERGGDGPLRVMEWGVGNGNLAACFLDRLRAEDAAGRVYPRVRYLLCDYSREILRGASAHPRLKEHPHVSALRADAEASASGFRPGSIHHILSNEIWDDLATKVLVKNDGLLYEEYLQPALDPGFLPVSFDRLCEDFARRDLSALGGLPPFLHRIEWRREYQRILLDEWPHAGVIQSHMESVGDGIPVPVNTGAFRTLERARALLAPDGFGYAGCDYGMLSLDEVNRDGRPYFNLYGGQYTFMVNFELLCAVGAAIGFRSVERVPQHRLVAEYLGDAVLSVLEILQTHPEAEGLAAWDRDILMLETLQAINGVYRAPYKRKLAYPVLDGTPKKQRRRIEELTKNLSPSGVPDTVAYVTEREAFAVIKQLQRLGYSDTALRRAFRSPRGPIAFACASFR